MNILVCGCGSIGGLVAFRLSKKSSIAIYDKNSELLDKIKKNGLALVNKKKSFAYKVKIVNKLDDVAGIKFDWVLLATKCYDLEDLVIAVKKHCKFHNIMAVQNGLLHVKLFDRYLPGVNTYYATILSASHMYRHGIVKLFFDGRIYFGLHKGVFENLVDFGNLWRSSGFEVKVLRNSAGAVWAKLIFNAVMNPLPILIGKSYNFLEGKKGVVSLIKMALKEGVSVANKLGINLEFNPQRIVDKIYFGGMKEFNYFGSMYNDFVRNADTELDFITGELINQADFLGVDVPILKTIYSLVKRIQLQENHAYFR